MHVELHFAAATLLPFLLILSRMAGLFALVPLPIKDAGPSISRIVLALGSTVALYGRWPVLHVDQLNLTTLVAFIIPDAALGMAIGLMVSLLSEAFTLGAQTLSVQAGYGYASVVDPMTSAESDVLAVLAQLLAGLFFFTTGLHRVLVKALADSLERFPPGSFSFTRPLATELIRLGSATFVTGLRLAMPIIGLLLTAELSLALLGRVQSQLHLGTQAFPLKMLLSLACLSLILVVTPALYRGFAEQVFGSVLRIFTR